MDCIQEFGKHANFMQLLFYHEQEENHEIMRPRPNKNFLHFSEKSDKDLQDEIFQSNTRTDVNLELLTDDNKKTSKQSTIAQNHEEASIDQEDVLDFAAVDYDYINDSDFQTKIDDGKIIPQKTTLVQNEQELAAVSKLSVYEEQEYPLSVNNFEMTPKENALMQKSQEVTPEDCHFDLSIDDNNDEELEFQTLAKYLNGSHQIKTQT